MYTQGLVAQGTLPARAAGAHAGGGGEDWLANPALPEDIVQETVPGNIRRAEHFVTFMRRLVSYLRERLRATQVGLDFVLN